LPGAGDRCSRRNRALPLPRIRCRALAVVARHCGNTVGDGHGRRAHRAGSTASGGHVLSRSSAAVTRKISQVTRGWNGDDWPTRSTGARARTRRRGGQPDHLPARALRVDIEHHRTGLAWTLSGDTTAADVDRIIAILEPCGASGLAVRTDPISKTDRAPPARTDRVNDAHDPSGRHCGSAPARSPARCSTSSVGRTTRVSPGGSSTTASTMRQ